MQINPYETPKVSISWDDNLQTKSGVIFSSVNVLVYDLRFKSCNTCSMVESQLHTYIYTGTEEPEILPHHNKD